MSDSGVTDSGRQLQSGNDYKPSERAAKAARQANTTGSNPVYAEKRTDGNEEARKGSGENPTNHAGKKAPGVDAAYTSSQDPNLSTRSFGERSA